MKIVTEQVHPDEGCHGLYEGPRDDRWITALYVVRGDTIAEHVEDHGPALEFSRIPPMMMPSFGENSVAEMQEWGERHRHDLRWYHRAQERLGESTLIQDVIEQEAQRREFLHNRSVSGPYQTTQRSGTARDALLRRYKEREAQ